MATIGMISSIAASDDSFTISVGFFALVLLCFAFAWDGLIRRRTLLHAFPYAGAFGSQAALIQGIWAVALGLVAAVLGAFMLLIVWGTFLVATQRHCHGHLTLACMGTLVGTVQGFAWGWLGLFVFWFVFVWLRMGDPLKRVLVDGVWYHQEQVARRVLQELQARQLPALPRERIYALEGEIVQLMHAQGWLVHGKAGLDGGKRAPRDVPVANMYDTVLHLPTYQNRSKAEHVAMRVLLEYFATAAQRAQGMSPLRRWWIGTAQLGKGMVYGRRAI